MLTLSVYRPLVPPATGTTGPVEASAWSLTLISRARSGWREPVSFDDRPGVLGTGYLVRRRSQRFRDGCPRIRLVLPWDAQQPHTPHGHFERRDQFLSPPQDQTVKSRKGVLGRCHADWDEPLRVRYSDRRKQGASEAHICRIQASRAIGAIPALSPLQVGPRCCMPWIPTCTGLSHPDLGHIFDPHRAGDGSRATTWPNPARYGPSTAADAAANGRSCPGWCRIGSCDPVNLRPLVGVLDLGSGAEQRTRTGHAVSAQRGGRDGHSVRCRRSGPVALVEIGSPSPRGLSALRGLYPPWRPGRPRSSRTGSGTPPRS